jgi:hypothetical protein
MSIKSCKKVALKKCDKICDDVSSTSNSYQEKDLSRTEILSIDRKQEKRAILECLECNYVTSRKSSFDKHILSAKHKNLKKLQKSCNQNNCVNKCVICNKHYNDPSGLWRHNKKFHNNNEITINEQMTEQKTEQKYHDDTNKLTELVIKMVEQNKELTKQIIELCNTGNNSVINANNNTINNTINSNNTFNLQIYLNETCKNAINMSEFVSSLSISVNDLEETARLGYSEGISKIFLNGLKDINVHNRPIHCADQKREVLYIKNNNEWFKDTDDKLELTNAIKNIAHKNIKQISEWQKLHPDYNNPDSKQNDKYQQILLNAMSGSTKEESNKNYEKIIRNVVKGTVIKKYN